MFAWNMVGALVLLPALARWLLPAPVQPAPRAAAPATAAPASATLVLSASPSPLESPR
jgi:hypothetical protein